MASNDIPNWLYKEGKEDNIVLYSIVKLYRNIEKMHFSIYANEEEINIIDSIFENAVKETPLSDSMKNIKLSNITPINIAVYRENMTIPYKKNIIYSRLFINEDEDNSILINSSEHCIIQSFKRGLEISKAFEETYEIENILDKKINFAFDKRLGYLTSSVKTIGCAMNMLIALSLPVLSWWNINSIKNFIYKCESNGYSVTTKKTLEEEPILYITNRSMIGISERSILDNIISLINNIINLEKKSRERILKIERHEIEDKIYRSHAILSSARQISYRELMGNIVWLRAGIYYGILNINLDTLNKLMIIAKPYHLKALLKTQTEENIKVVRAKIVRDLIK